MANKTTEWKQDFRAGIIAWLKRVTLAEQPPASVIAFNVGLFETPDGYSAYLMGADAYDPNDSDWACDETFTPADRYYSISVSESKRDWEEVHRATADTVRQFMKSSKGKKSYLARAEIVTVGFDDGDLERIV